MIHTSLAVFVASILLLVACDRNQGIVPKTGESQQQKKASPAKETQDQASKNEQTDYLNTARQEIDQLQREIDALTIKAKNSSTDLKVRMEREIQDFQEQLNAIEKKWRGIKDGSVATWEELKNSLTDSIEKLGQALHKASG